MKKLIGSISVALTLALSVFGLAACDLVNFNWGTGSDHEHHFTEYEATDPTCTKNGNYRYFKCDVGPDPCGRYYLDLAAMEPVSEESVMIPALGHEYDFTNIVWSEWNGKEITASVTCTQCDEEEPGHVLNPKITVEFTQTKAPTCTAKGEGYYTASFTYEGETYTNPTTNAAEVDMIPHTYNKVPDDGWKWADGHTSVSATFTCTAADCTHTETVTVSGAAITSKVETIKGVCTDGSQTVYTATAEFNGETYDLTDTVVTRAAINEHKVGDWQYDATQHWHKCSVCGEDMDDKASHQPDSSTHKCECGYEEESYTVTAASINAADGKVVLTINGTCTGYTQETLAAAFKTFGFYGGGWTYPASEDFTLTLTEKAWTITVDVTKMENKSYSVCLESKSGYGDIKPTFEVTGSAELNNKTYTLSKNGDGNLTLTIADKVVEKTHTITDAAIAEKDGKVYVTVTGTYAGYANAAEFLADLQDGQDTTKLGFCVFKNSDDWGKVIDYNSELIQYSAKDNDGNKFSVQIDVTDLPARGYQIGHDYSSEGDIKTVNYTGTAETATKTYELVGNTGNLTLTIKEKQAGEYSVTSLSLEADAENQKVYLVVKGTFSGYTQETLQSTVFSPTEGEITFWAGNLSKIERHSGATVTVEGSNYTAKLDVTSLGQDGLRNILKGGNDWKAASEQIEEKTVDLADKRYTLQKSNGWSNIGLAVQKVFTVQEASISAVEGKAVITLKGTFLGEKADFEKVLSDSDESNVCFRLIHTGTPNWDKATGYISSYEVGSGTFTVKIDVTELDAKNPLNTNRSWYLNQQSGANSDIKSLTVKYDVTITVGTKTYQLVGTPGANIALFIKDAPAPAKTATFADADLLKFGTDQVRVLLRITATGFSTEELAKENVKLTIGAGEPIPAHENNNNEYYFYVTTSSTGNLKVTIGGMEFTKNLATSVTEVNSKQFLNPNFYTLALNGDDLVLTVINAAEAFTLNGISLKNTDGTVNLTLTGTTTAADATAKLFLENYGYCYYKNGRQQFANKTVTVEGGAFTFTVNVTDLGAGSYTLLARDADGTDLTNGDISLESITDKEATKDSIRYSIVNVEGTKLALLIEDSAHETSYNKLSLKATADTLYLVIEGTYSGYSIEDIKAVLENMDGAKEPYSFSIYDGFGKNFPREATVTPSKDSATDGTWKLEINITTFQTTGVPHHILERDAGGGDLKVKDGKPEFESTVVEFKNLNYSLVLDGDILSLKVVDATQPSYEITSGSVELADNKVYFSINGTYANYEPEELRALLAEKKISFKVFPGGSLPAEYQNLTGTVTVADGQWHFKIDVTDYPANAYLTSFDGQEVKLNNKVNNGMSVVLDNKTYTIVNDNTDPGSEAYYWSATTLKITEKIALKDGEINFGVEDPVAISNPDHMFYWNGKTEGTNATVTTKTAVDGVYTFAYTMTAGTDWWSVQLFYKNSALKENTVYTLTFQLKSSVTGKITVNGTVIDLTGNNQVQTVSVEYTQTAKASLSIQFGVDGNAPLEGGTFVISELKWQEKTSGPEEPAKEFKLNEADLTSETQTSIRIFFMSTATGYDGLTKESFQLVLNGQTITAMIYTDGAIHFSCPISDLTDGSYPLAFKLNGEDFPFNGLKINTNLNTLTLSNGNKYTIETTDGSSLTLKVEISKTPLEKEATGFAGTAYVKDGDTKIYIAINLTVQGYSDAAKLINDAVLYIGDLKFTPRQSGSTIGALYFDIAGGEVTVESLTPGGYNVVLKLDGETKEYACPTIETGQIGQPIKLNGKTFTLATTGDTDKNLQLTVAAVAPAADGSQDAPFSVSDLAAIFEDDSQFGTFSGQSYYTGGGSEPQKVYVEGYVTDIGEWTGEYFKNVKISTQAPTGIALVSTEFTEILIYTVNTTLGTQLALGDHLVVSGYLKNYQGKTPEICSNDGDYAQIETWESANKDNEGADAELEWEAIKKALSISEDKLTLENEVALPKPTRPNVTFTFAVQEGENSDKLTIANEKMTPTRGESQVTGITVNVTIKVGENDFARSFTVTIPEEEAEPTDPGWYVVDALSKIESGVRIVFVYADKNIVGSGFDSTHLSSVTGVVFNEDKSMITTLPGDAVVWTVGGEENAWTFTSTEGTLAQTGNSNNKLNGVGTDNEWTITINNENNGATISNNAHASNADWRLQFNPQNNWLSNYSSSQKAPTIYRWYGEWVEPHKCQHQCPTCNKCTDEGCDDPVCADKCKGHESVSGSYTLVTSEEQLHAGDTIVFVYEQYTFGTYDSSKKRFNGMTGVTYSEDKNVITSLPKNTIVWTVGGQKDAWTFYATIDDTTSGYLAQTGNKSGQATALSTTNNTWTLTFKDGSLNAITNANQKTFKFQCNPNINNGDPIFSNYTSAQKTPSIYVAS